MTKIEDILQGLGVKEEAARGYVTLLDMGGGTAGDLARKMGMPRPTLYGYLDQLVSVGLATQGLRLGVKVYVPEPVRKVKLLLQKQVEEIRAREKAFDKILPQIESKASGRYLRPRFQAFEGREALESCMENILKYPNLKTLTLWPIKAAIEATSADFFHYFNKERIRRNIYVDAIWPKKHAVEMKRYPFMGGGEMFRREIRMAPEDIDFTTGCWIYANKVMFISSRMESSAYIIESEDLVKSMSSYHAFIWARSTPIMTNAKDVKAFLDEIKEE
jgi:sugar-specific transcriptional regulator TrmB